MLGDYITIASALLYRHGLHSPSCATMVDRLAKVWRIILYSVRQSLVG